MNGLALFPGILGLELGLHVAIGSAYQTVGYVERDAYAAAAIVARMEGSEVASAPICDDVRSFDGRPWRGVVDLISGGFPCQDISLAGSGEGLEGERSGLWFEFARIIREVEPSLVFVENVAALRTRGLDRVLADLSECGFDAEWDVFSAAGVGAPHLRRRMFILARRVSDAGGQPVRVEPERSGEWARSADERDAESGDVGADLADASGIGRPRLGWRGQERAAEPGEAMADAGGDRLEGEQRGGAAPGTAWGCDSPLADASSERSDTRAQPATAEPGRRRVGPPDRGASMGDADIGGLGIERLEECPGLEGASGDQPHGHDSDGGLLWPPGPGDAEGWDAYLAAGGPEPALRRGAHGVPVGLEYRTDRLRCLGNAVVPLVAAHAFRTLAARLGVTW